MIDDKNFKFKIEQTVKEVLNEIEKSKSISPWQLKLKLRIPSSQLYMALGYLINQNKIIITPDGLNYKVAAALSADKQTIHH